MNVHDYCVCALVLCGGLVIQGCSTELRVVSHGNAVASQHMNGAFTNVVALSDYEVAELRSRALRIRSDPTAAFIVYRHDHAKGLMSADDELTYLMVACQGLYSAALELGKKYLDDPTMENGLEMAHLLLSGAASNSCVEAAVLLSEVEKRMSTIDLKSRQVTNDHTINMKGR
jgi:hypothetical protein